MQPDPPGDGPIDIRDDHFIVPVPEVDGAFTAAGALVLRGDAKNHIVGAILQLQAFLENMNRLCASRGGPDSGVVGPLQALKSTLASPGHCEVLSSVSGASSVQGWTGNLSQTQLSLAPLTKQPPTLYRSFCF